MTVEALQVPVYRPFAVQVARVQRLGPSFLRVTFTGAELDQCAPNGFDQRIKVLFPAAGLGLADWPTGPDWYGEWRALPEERRNALRTYSIRAWRPEPREMDVYFVLHGSTGPASAWAEQAAVGDEVALIAPNARFPGATGGFEWHPPADSSCLLLAGDETAVPAICAIVERLPAGRRAGWPLRGRGGRWRRGASGPRPRAVLGRCCAPRPVPGLRPPAPRPAFHACVAMGRRGVRRPGTTACPRPLPSREAPPSHSA